MNSDAQDVTRRVARAWADMIYIWMDLMGPLADRAAGEMRERMARARGGEPPATGWSRHDHEWAEVTPGAKHAAKGESAAGVCFEVDVTSARPTGVHLDLHVAPKGKKLVVQKLQRSDGEDGPALGGVALETADDGGVVVKLAVAADQPAGTYAGLVIDRETKKPAGTVTVSIRDLRMTALVPEVLAEYGRATRSAMRTYLEPREPKRYLYDLVADYPSRGGRALRPSLCIATARAFGASVDDAVLTAASIELLHNALLVHDDIEDESEMRRGRAALHVEQGVPLALNAGDLLALVSLRPLVDNRDRLGLRLSLRLIEETERMAIESAEGQALELGWRRDNARDVTEADYLEMVLKKTCWLGMIHPSRTGALIGGADGIDLDAFIRFGFFLGAAFQIQDDVLNLVGDGASYGKELGGDIHEGKRTLMLIRLVEACDDAERERVFAMLGTPRAERTRDDVAFTRDAMDRYGCIDYAREVANGLAGAAQHEHARIFESVPKSRDVRFLEELPTWVIERS